MIAILCPTRGRPEQFARMVSSIRSMNVRVLMGYEKQEFDVYYEHICKCRPPFEISPIELHDMLPTAHKWNLLSEVAMINRSSYHDCNLFMLGADDMAFETPGWDKALIDHYNALENKIHVYSLQDSRDENGTPHIICTREYIEAMGYFVPPIFLHWFVDSWTVQIARANNCFTHFKEFVLRHDKPSDVGKPDETHSRIRQWGWHERDKWVAEKMGHVLKGEIKRLGEELGVR